MFGNRNRSRFWVHNDLVFTVAQPNDSATAIRPVGRKTRRAQNMLLENPNRAGFEPFPARGVVPLSKNRIMANAENVQPPVVEAISTARLKTGASESKQQVASKARRVFRPTTSWASSRPHAHTPIRAPSLPVRHPDILYLGGVPEEFFALALFTGKPVARFAVGNPCCFEAAG